MSCGEMCNSVTYSRASLRSIVVSLLVIVLFCYLTATRYSTHLHSVKTNIKPTYVSNPIYSKISSDNTSSESKQIVLSDSINTEFISPYGFTYPADVMITSHWAVSMKRKLDEGKFGKQLTFLMVNSGYFSTLLNWLAHAKLHAEPLMENLLVVCLDEKSHVMLLNKGIISTVVKIEDVLKGIKEGAGVGFGGMVAVRLTLLRLLNHWGYDVLQMDTDALFMNNIQPILDQFKDSDIVTTVIKHSECLPKIAYDTWGFCLCTGVLLMRSTPNTEKMWQIMGRSHRSGSDQNIFNSILTTLEFSWTPFTDNNSVQHLKGVSTNYNITVIALSEDVVCRDSCDPAKLSSYYVCHPHSPHNGTSKHRWLSQQQLWIVTDKWAEMQSTVQPTAEWLKEITV